MFEFFSKTLSDFHAITSNLPDKTKALSMKLMFLYMHILGNRNQHLTAK